MEALLGGAIIGAAAGAGMASLPRYRLASGLSRAEPVATEERPPAEADVVVIGAGVAGLATALYLNEHGMKVLVLEKGVVAGEQSSRAFGWIYSNGWHPEKLELAKRCGADLTINIAEQDAVAIVKELTDGYGADVYLEGTGHPSAVPQGLNLLRKLGRYVEYGVFGSDVSVDWSIISDDKELDVLGAHLGPYCWPAAIKMIESGVLPMDQICTHQLPLAEFQKGLDLVASGKESVKVSLIPA